MTNKNKIKEMLDIAIAENAIISRGNIISFKIDTGSVYRWNIKKNVIRFEKKVSKSMWKRISSHNIKKFDLDSWREIMANVANEQHKGV
jgi:hypothetical protein